MTDEVLHDDLALTFVAVADSHEDVADAEETVRVEESLSGHQRESMARSFAIAMLLASGWLDEARILGRRRQRKNSFNERVREGDVTL